MVDNIYIYHTTYGNPVDVSASAWAYAACIFVDSLSSSVCCFVSGEEASKRQYNPSCDVYLRLTDVAQVN